MTILKLEPGKKPEEADIPDTLCAMQEIVGGSIQALYPFGDLVALICNEEGKLLGLPLNRPCATPKRERSMISCAGPAFSAVRRRAATALPA